jgi:hypothetical protein
MYKSIYNNICNRGSQRKSLYRRGSGLHKHHIIPKHSGGKDEESNYTYLTEREHIIAHFLLWKINRTEKDLWSCQYLNAKSFIPKNIRKQQASKGGKIGGKKQAELGLGFHQYKNNPELHKTWASLGGKAHKNKKTMYKPGDKTFIRVLPKNFQYYLNNGYIFGSPIVSPNKGKKTNIPSPKRKKVTDGKVIYESVHDAATKNNISDGTVIYRCKSKKSIWKYVYDNES